MLRITLPDGSVKQVTEGTTFAEIGKAVEKEYDSPLAVAVLNGQEYSLRQPVMEEGDVDFIPLRSVEGMRAFTRSLTFVCIVAMSIRCFSSAAISSYRSFDRYSMPQI